ncbi:MAG TPA: hypothetical protein VH595_17325 [Verrucomicrobiae bacterium]|nr:hypothetical protein [Verrucomicrobiae bacterium]
MKNLSAALTLLALLAFAFQPSTANAQGTAFTYQGQLNNGGGPAGGLYDFQFTIYDAVTKGNVVGGPLLDSDAAVTNGLFTAQLDFGASVFNGNPRWLEIGVRTNGTASFTILTNRQPITSTPYAVQSLTASAANSISASNINGTISTAQLPPSLLTNDAGSVTLSGAFTGSGAGLSNLNAPQLTGVIADARLSTNVPLLNANQTFTGANAFSQPLQLNSNVTVKGATQLNSNLTVNGNIVLNGGLNTIGAAVLRSGVTVSGISQFNGALTVAGIQFTNGYSALEGQELLRIIRGTVSATGNVLQGSGFSVGHTGGSGVYTINFANPFSGIPSVTATAVDDLARSGGIVTTNYVTIGTLTLNGAPADDAFNFIAIGPP